MRPEQSEVLVAPLTRARQLDVLGARHVERRSTRTEQTLDALRQWRGELERQSLSGAGRTDLAVRLGPESLERRLEPQPLEVRAGEVPAVLLEGDAGRRTDRNGPGLGREQDPPRVGGEVHVALTGVVRDPQPGPGWPQ